MFYAANRSAHVELRCMQAGQKNACEYINSFSETI